MKRTVFFHLHVGMVYPEDWLLPVLTAPAPSLRTAYLFSKRTPPVGALDNVRLLPHATRLDVLYSVGVIRAGPSTYPGLVRAELQNCVANDERDDIAHIVRTSPNLKTLRVDFAAFSYDADADAHPTPVTASKLRNLTLQLSEAPDAPVHELAARISLPKLNNLTLYACPNSCTVAMSYLGALVDNNDAAGIEYLCLSDLSQECISDLVYALGKMPKVTRMKIDDTRFTRRSLAQFCAGLYDGDTNTVVAPALDDIHLNNCAFDADCDAEDIFKMIKGRLSAASGEPGVGRPAQLLAMEVNGWAESGLEDIQPRVEELLRDAWMARERRHTEVA